MTLDLSPPSGISITILSPRQALLYVLLLWVNIFHDVLKLKLINIYITVTLKIRNIIVSRL